MTAHHVAVRVCAALTPAQYQELENAEEPTLYQCFIDDSGSMNIDLQFSSNPDGTLYNNVYAKRQQQQELQVYFKWFAEGLRMASVDLAQVPLMFISNWATGYSESLGQVLQSGLQDPLHRSTPATESLLARIPYLLETEGRDVTTWYATDGIPTMIEDKGLVYEYFPQVRTSQPRSAMGWFSRVIWELQKRFPRHFITFIGIGDNTDFLDNIDTFVNITLANLN